MSIHVKVGGNWQEIAANQATECGNVKVNGTWRTVTGAYVKVGTDWKTVCEPVPAYYAPYYAPSGGGGGSPLQDSTIYNISPTSGSTAGGYTLTINGSFPSSVTNISVNGTNISGWSQTSNRITFTMPSGPAASVTITVFNGRLPLMADQSFTYVSSGGSGGSSGGTPNIDCVNPISTNNTQISVSTSICTSGLQNATISSYNTGCNPATSTSYGSCVAPAESCGSCGAQNNIPADNYYGCQGYDYYYYTERYQRKYCPSSNSYSYDCPSVVTSSLVASNSSTCGYTAPVSCTCNYSRYGDYLIAPECCAGTNCCVQYSPQTYFAPTFTYWAPYWVPFFDPTPYFTPTFTYWAPFFDPTPYFAPYFSSSGGGCIEARTKIQTPTGFKLAKDLKIGDDVFSAVFAELSDDETVDRVDSWNSETLTPLSMRTTKIKAIKQTMDVSTYMRINGDYFSLNQTILIYRDGQYKFILSGAVKLGDKVLKRNGSGIEDLEYLIVTDLLIIYDNSTVYQFDTEDGDVFFTENMLVHNQKLPWWLL